MKEDNEYQGPKSKYITHKYVSFLLRNTSFFSVLEMISSAQATPGLGSSSCSFTLASEAAGAASDYPHLTKHLSLRAPTIRCCSSHENKIVSGLMELT